MRMIVLMVSLSSCANLQDNTDNTDKAIIAASVIAYTIFYTQVHQQE
jgi:hypothetical protein